MAAILSFLKALVAILENRGNQAELSDKLDVIKDNHLAHIHAEITGLSARIGGVEGKLNVLQGILVGICLAIVGVLLQGFFLR